MFISFFDEDARRMYDNEAVIALVGKRATRLFCDFSLSINELRSSLSFVCFDAPLKEDRTWSINDQPDNKPKFGMNERLSLCDTDMLFVLSDLEDTDDVEICLRYVERVKEDGLSFLVTHEKNKSCEKLACLSAEYDHIIYVENEKENLFYPVKQLICDYNRPGFIGIDMYDVFSVFPHQQKKTASFFRRAFANMDSVIEYIPNLLQCFEERKQSENSCPDLLIFMEVSPKYGLEDIDRVPRAFAQAYKDSQIIWSCNFDSKESGEGCTLLIQAVYPN